MPRYKAAHAIAVPNQVIVWAMSRYLSIHNRELNKNNVKPKNNAKPNKNAKPNNNVKSNSNDNL
jgi:hypothetical protein